MNMIAFILASGVLFNSLSGTECTCRPPAPDEQTHPGGNTRMTLVEKKSYKKLQGAVHDQNDEAVSDVLVEVFDHPEGLLPNYSGPLAEQNRIAVCKAGETGEFCFDNLPSGHYELRISKDAAWNPSRIYVTVNRRKGSRAKMKVTLTVGT